MIQEKESSHQKWVKFDLKRRKVQQQHLIEKYSNDKRKPSCSLSSDACKSPIKKSLKLYEYQNPGENSYFLNLFRKDNEVGQFIDYLRSLPPLNVSTLDLKLQIILKSINFTINDEERLISYLDNVGLLQEDMEWNMQDNKLLVWIICKLGIHHSRWKDVATLFQRSIPYMKTRWNDLIQNCQAGSLWTQQEDQTLSSMVMTYLSNQQNINWKCMANVLNKNFKQCRDRWCNYLDPGLCRDGFRIEEDLLILQLVLRFGKRWSKIQREWSFSRKRSKQDIKKRFLELLNIQDSGYDSDISSQSQKRNNKIQQEDALRIKNLMNDLRNQEMMQVENKQVSKDKLLKTKLLNIAKSDLDKILNEQRQIQIQVSQPPLQVNKSQDMEMDQVKEVEVPNTPLIMNNLSRCLLNINLENDEDELSIEKPFRQTVHYSVKNLENLKHEDLFEIQFALVNDNMRTIYFANLEFMQQLLNLITNQRKLMSLTDVKSPLKVNLNQRTNRKKFSSQQLIQLKQTENGIKKPGLSKFCHEIGSDGNQ